MKILWHSNSPLAGTGYGNQTYIFTNLLKKAGWEVIVSAFYGLSGNKIEYDGINILPRGLDPWGNDILEAHYSSHKPDILFALMDSWVLKDNIFSLPLALWLPVDHEPAPKAVVNAALKTPFPIAMSFTGERLLRKEGVDPFFIPHGVDTTFYKQMDRSVAREVFKVDDDTFFVIMNAANKGYPSRKRFEGVIKAWSIFTEKHPNSILYLHTLPEPVEHGLPLLEMCEFYNVAHSVRFPNTYDYVQGNFSWAFLKKLYNAADVLLAPSTGEGFGIPVIEAHACGCPTIVSDFTAQRELWSAYKIPIDPVDDQMFTLQGAEWAFAKVSEIVKALEWAYENKGNSKLRDEARDVGMDYDAEYVFNKYMLPTFGIIKQLSPAF